MVKVVGSNPIWDSDFFRVYASPRIYSYYHVVVVSSLMRNMPRIER